MMVQKLEKQEKKVAGKNGGAQEQPAFMRTHPLTSDRVQACVASLAEVQNVFEASGCDAELMSRLSSLRMHGKHAWNPFYRPTI